MVGEIQLHPDENNIVAMQINDPGEVLAVAWCLEKRLVMTRGDAQFGEVLTMFVEVAHDGPKRNRRFVVLPTGVPAKAPDGYSLTFIATAVSGNTGNVAHVYDIRTVS